uniref:Uncharacterized protein n=1 Tax=Anopheles maculatus TaxID=74869 RepID=A0A182SW28_9DIPT
MRKKHLIELPEQEIIELPASAHETSETSISAGSNESLQGMNDLSSITTLPMDEVSTATEVLGVIPSLVVALPPPSPVPPFIERREQIVASAPPASDSSSPPPPQLLETDLDVVVQERPRQAGRRAQSQPRIGSITV